MNIQGEQGVGAHTCRLPSLTVKIHTFQSFWFDRTWKHNLYCSCFASSRDSGRIPERYSGLQPKRLGIHASSTFAASFLIHHNRAICWSRHILFNVNKLRYGRRVVGARSAWLVYRSTFRLLAVHYANPDVLRGVPFLPLRLVPKFNKLITMNL